MKIIVDIVKLLLFAFISMIVLMTLGNLDLGVMALIAFYVCISRRANYD
jgi:hypothetical protein